MNKSRRMGLTEYGRKQESMHDFGRKPRRKETTRQTKMKMGK
jgi:hypothetical protein